MISPRAKGQAVSRQGSVRYRGISRVRLWTVVAVPTSVYAAYAPRAGRREAGDAEHGNRVCPLSFQAERVGAIARVERLLDDEQLQLDHGRGQGPTVRASSSEEATVERSRPRVQGCDA